MKSHIQKTLLLAIIGFYLVACGNKGDLHPPKQPDKSSVESIKSSL